MKLVMRCVGCVILSVLCFWFSIRLGEQLPSLKMIAQEKQDAYEKAVMHDPKPTVRARYGFGPDPLDRINLPEVLEIGQVAKAARERAAQGERWSSWLFYAGFGFIGLMGVILTAWKLTRGDDHESTNHLCWDSGSSCDSRDRSGGDPAKPGTDETPCRN